jgi:phospholipid/cholesterol/gamma-HCH transport system substrate-binding protein
MAPRAPGVEFSRQRNVEVVMRIDKRYKDEILSDSRASLVTEGLLGNRYVRITRGVSGTALDAKGEVPGEEEVAMKQIVERGADLVQNLGELSKEVRGIIAGVKQGEGSLGLLLTDETLYTRLSASAGRLDTMLAETQEGKNSLGKFVANDELYQRINSAAARLDKLIADVQEQNGTLGKLVHDPKLYDDARAFVEKGNAFLADVRAGKGSLGKLANDDQLYNNLRDSAAGLKEATDKLNKGQGSAAKIFNDPQLYDNLTGLSGDLRLLIADFRQNPKKYLRIKLGIF